jgi:anthranilate phosphoribosyltransferase
MGVFHADLVGIQARVLQRLGSRRVMIAHGMEGLDEISISGPTMVAELKDGEIREYTIAPQEFGFTVRGTAEIRVDGVEPSKAMVLAALGNQDSAARDVVALNAGASIYVAGLAGTLAEGVKKALTTIASGAARKKLDQFVAFTRSHG